MTSWILWKVNDNHLLSTIYFWCLQTNYWLVFCTYNLIWCGIDAITLMSIMLICRAEFSRADWYDTFLPHILRGLLVQFWNWRQWKRSEWGLPGCQIHHCPNLPEALFMNPLPRAAHSIPLFMNPLPRAAHSIPSAFSVEPNNLCCDFSVLCDALATCMDRYSISCCKLYVMW